jgi:hypothetical protein
MLRWLALVLLGANLLYWAWSSGTLGPVLGWSPTSERDPSRWQQQVRPELLRVLPAGAAPAASAASSAAAPAPTLACLESQVLAAAEVDAAEQALASRLPERGWLRASREAGTQYAVVIGPLARELLQKKRDELGRLKIGFEDLALAEPGAGGAGLSLGRYDSADAAKAALAGYSLRGVRTARVATLREATTELRLRFENLKPEQAEALRKLKAPALGPEGLVPCSASGAR